MPTKILSLFDVILTPLVDIVPGSVRRAIYAFVPVAVAVLGALVGSSVLSGTVAFWVGGVYAALTGLLAAANVKTSSTVSADLTPHVINQVSDILHSVADQVKSLVSSKGSVEAKATAAVTDAVKDAPAVESAASEVTTAVKAVKAAVAPAKKAAAKKAAPAAVTK